MRLLFPALALLLLTPLVGGTALAAESAPGYNYITAADLEARIMSGDRINLVDIQIQKEFEQHHIAGAIPTYAYPVKSEEDRARLAVILKRIQENDAPVVIVCPRGAGGATRTYDYLLSQGVAQQRLMILEKGQEGWRCLPLTEGGQP